MREQDQTSTRLGVCKSIGYSFQLLHTKTDAGDAEVPELSFAGRWFFVALCAAVLAALYSGMMRYAMGLHPGLQEVFHDFIALLICCYVLELLLQKLRAIAFMCLLHREKLPLSVAEQIVLPYSILIWPAYSIAALALVLVAPWAGYLSLTALQVCCARAVRVRLEELLHIEHVIARRTVALYLLLANAAWALLFIRQIV